MRAQRLPVGDDRQLCAAHLFEKRLQFLGPVPGRRRGVVGQHDLVVRLAAVGQHQIAGRADAEKNKQKRPQRKRASCAET